MIVLKTEEKQNIQNKEPGNSITNEIKILLLFLGLLIIGIIGYFTSSDHWVGYIFAHLGGLGIVGLLGGLTGIIAKKKGYDYWKVFLLGLILPVIVGIFFVLFTAFSCGGSPSLGTAILVVIFYSLIKRRNSNKRIVSL